MIYPEQPSIPQIVERLQSLERRQQALIAALIEALPHPNTLDACPESVSIKGFNQFELLGESFERWLAEIKPPIPPADD